MDIRRKRLAAGWTAQRAVELLRDAAPGMDKALLSKAENPGRYGVRLTQDLERMLCEAFGGPVAKENKSRINRRAVRVRLVEAKFSRLQHYVKSRGLTVQAFLESCVDRALAEGGEE